MKKSSFRIMEPPELYGWVMSDIWIICWPQKPERWDQFWLYYVTYMNESCHTHKEVMSHIYKYFTCYTAEITRPRFVSCHKFTCSTSHICTHMKAWQPRRWVAGRQLAHSYVWHESFVYRFKCGVLCVTWLIHIDVGVRSVTGDTTHSYVWHNSFIHTLVSRVPSLDFFEVYLLLI